MAENFSITIKNSVYEISVSGTEDFINKWYKKLKEEAGDNHSLKENNLEVSVKHTPPSRVSLPEMLRGSSVKTMNDTIMLFVFFMEKNEVMTSVNTADISNAFVRAKKIAPKNITNQVIQLISQGLLYEEPEKKNNLKTVTLTDTGLKHVSEKLLATKE